MNKPKPFDSANFVPVPRVPEWPVSQPENIPYNWKKVAVKYQDRGGENYNWVFYFDGEMLIIYNHEDAINRFNGDPIRHIEQYEFPIQAAAWFVENIQRFFKKPGENGALPIDSFHLREKVGNEELNISRLVHTYGPGIAGYSLDNLSRCEHPDMDLCQSFEMSDRFLFEEGMLELFKDIAHRHANNLL